MNIAEQREGKFLGFGVSGMCERAIGANSEDCGAAPPDLWVDLDEADELWGSDVAPVKAVEDEHHVLPSKR